MQTTIEALVELKTGYAEIVGEKISLVGVSDPKAGQKLKDNVLRQAPKSGTSETLRLGSIEKQRFDWVAFRYRDDNDSDTIELIGAVADEATRTKLIAIARSASKKVIVVDRMRLQPDQPPYLGAAALAGIAQIASLHDGLFWINERKVGLVGSSFQHSVKDRELGCKELRKVMPRGISCAAFNIVQQQETPHYPHHRHRGGERNQDTQEQFSPKKPFVAADPAKIAVGSSVEGSTDPRTVDILYATSRKLERANSPFDASYSGDRSPSLNYGLARVRVPRGP